MKKDISKKEALECINLVFKKSYFSLIAEKSESELDFSTFTFAEKVKDFVDKRFIFLIALNEFLSIDRSEWSFKDFEEFLLKAERDIRKKYNI